MTSKFVAMATSIEVKDTLLLSFSGLELKNYSVKVFVFDIFLFDR